MIKPLEQIKEPIDWNYALRLETGLKISNDCPSNEVGEAKYDETIKRYTIVSKEPFLTIREGTYAFVNDNRLYIIEQYYVPNGRLTRCSFKIYSIIDPIQIAPVSVGLVLKKLGQKDIDYLRNNLDLINECFTVEEVVERIKNESLSKLSK